MPLNNEAPPHTPDVTQVRGRVVTEYKSQFDFTFDRPSAPSTLRFDESGVTANDPELSLSGGDHLETKQRLKYAPGTQAVPGCGVRLSAAPGPGESVKWGPFDGTNGVGFGADENGAFAFVMTDGSITKTHHDDMDHGRVGPNEFVSDHPVVCRFPFTYYGGGSIFYRLLKHVGTDNSPALKTAHVHSPGEGAAPSGPPTETPNVPVRAECSSGYTGTLHVTAVHGTAGSEETDSRANGEFFDISSVGTSSWAHIISIRKRSNWGHVAVKPSRLSPIATANMKFALLTNSALSVSGTWSQAADTSASESAVEYLSGSDATIDSTGERRGVDVAAGGGVNTSGDVRVGDINYELGANDTLTIAAKGFTSGDVNGCFEWSELF